MICDLGCTPYGAGVNLPNEPIPIVELQALKARGFDHVRQPFDPETADIEKLKQLVANERAAGLQVIVDAHPKAEFKARFFADPKVRDAFVAMWRTVMTAIPADGVYFELMNEPGSDSWWPIQGRMIADLRMMTSAPIVANGGNSSSLADLLSERPYRIANVVYNFHFYNPMRFSHQGVPWNPKWSGLKDIRYPGEGYDAEKLRKRFDAANQWSKTYKVPITCNEFGAWRAAPSPDREAYLRDVSSALKAANIGRTVWQYKGGFLYSPDAILP